MYRSKMVFLLVLLVACSFLTVQTQASEYKEAPMLAELVSAGKLPPVEERLPKSPLVIEPVESIGVYGGNMYSAIRGAAEEAYLRTSVWYDPLVRWNRDNNDVIPGLAESWEAGDGLLLDLDDAIQELLWRHDVAHAPTGHREGLREPVYRYGPLEHPGYRGRGDMLALVDDVLIDLVGQDVEVMVLGQVCYRF